MYFYRLAKTIFETMKSASKRFLVVLGVAVAAINCNAHTAAENAKSKVKQVQALCQEFLLVYVDDNGLVTVDGTPVTLQELEEQLKQLEARGGFVKYSRANSQKEPHKNCMKVIELVVENGLAIQFYLDKTFETPVKR